MVSRIARILYASYRHAHAYWIYAERKKAREVTVVFLFAFITALASLIRTQLPIGVYYAFFLFVVGYAASVALFPETRTLDKVWLSFAMSLALPIVITFTLLEVGLILGYQPAGLPIPLDVPEILMLLTVISLSAVLLKRLTTT